MLTEYGLTISSRRAVWEEQEKLVDLEPVAVEADQQKSQLAIYIMVYPMRILWYEIIVLS